MPPEFAGAHGHAVPPEFAGAHGHAVPSRARRRPPRRPERAFVRPVVPSALAHGATPTR